MKGIHLKYVFCALIACNLAAPEIKADITCRYWFDSETDLSKALTEKFDGNSIKLNLDASQLPYGLHKVSVMVGSSDQWSPVLCKLFYKPEPQKENVTRRLQLNVDGKKLYDKAFMAGSDIITLDAAKLPTGLHRIDCMVLSSTGDAITTGQKLFYKPEPEMTLNDWEMTFLADDQQLWNGSISEEEAVIPNFQFISNRYQLTSYKRT